MITGAVGWVWALGVFALAFLGIILSMMLVKAGSALEEKEEEVNMYRGHSARGHAHAPATAPATSATPGTVVTPGAAAPPAPSSPPVASPGAMPVMPSGTRPVMPPGTTPTSGTTPGTSQNPPSGF